MIPDYYTFASDKIIVQSRNEDELIDFLNKYGIPLEQIDIISNKGLYECYWHRKRKNKFPKEFFLIDITPDIYVYSYSEDGLYFYNNYRKIEIEQMKIFSFAEVVYSENKISEWESLKRLFVDNINTEPGFIMRYLTKRKDPFSFTEIFCESPLFQSLLIHIWKNLFEIEAKNHVLSHTEIVINYSFEPLFDWFRDYEPVLKDYQQYTYQALKMILKIKKGD